MPRRPRARVVAGGVAALALMLLLPLLIIRTKAHGRMAGDPEALPHRAGALVPGAGLNASGSVSWFLRDRLDGAIALYRLGKVDGLLLSGDNHVESYDEPSAMRAYALRKGVPPGAITLDYAGFDTYDTCARASRIFGVTSAIVVTQGYHLPRAVYLCRSVGIDAVGLAIADWGHVPTDKMVHYQAREVVADAKALWDAGIVRREPKFLGGREPLHLQPAAG